MTYVYILGTIAGISWARWFWKGYAYRGGFASADMNRPLIWTAVLLVLMTNQGIIL